MNFNITLECVQICKTSGKDYLEAEDRACLQNCGYNRMYLNKIYLQMEKWKFEANSPN